MFVACSTCTVFMASCVTSELCRLVVFLNALLLVLNLDLAGGKGCRSLASRGVLWRAGTHAGRCTIHIKPEATIACHLETCNGEPAYLCIAGIPSQLYCRCLLPWALSDLKSH